MSQQRPLTPGSVVLTVSISLLVGLPMIAVGAGVAVRLFAWIAGITL